MGGKTIWLKNKTETGLNFCTPKLEKEGDLLEFKNTEVWGFEHAIRGMRNPMDSWNKSDSYFGCENGSKHSEKYTACEDCLYSIECNTYNNKDNYIIGKEDMSLAQSLIKGGSEHSKFMRMIHVSVDIDMPRYWWSEADTYHFNTKNSCSTMHRLLNNNNPITIDQFVYCQEDLDVVEVVIDRLEELRKNFKEIQRTTKDSKKMNRLLIRAKRLLMEGFLQLRTWDTNYEEIRNMYFQRVYHPHKLKEEWVDEFGKWVKSLPYFKEFIAYTGE